MRFLYDKDSFDLAIGKQPYNKMPYCVMVKTAMADTKLKVTIDNFSCRSSRNVLGLTEPLDSFTTGESGKQLGLYCDLDTSKNVLSTLNPTEPLSDKLRIKEKFEENNIEFPVDTDKSYYYKYNKEDK